MLTETRIKELIIESAQIPTSDFKQEMQNNIKKAFFFFLQRLLAEQGNVFLSSNILNKHILLAVGWYNDSDITKKINVDGFFGKLWTEKDYKLPLEYQEILERPNKRRQSEPYQYRIHADYYLLVKNIFQELGFQPRIFPQESQQMSLFAISSKTSGDTKRLIQERCYWEGSRVLSLTSKYERNNQARRECILHYGYVCVVCQKSLEQIYGINAQYIIHVHHLELVASKKERYKLDPINDLRPVCPNCHAVIHSRQPIYSIEEVKQMMQ